MNKKLMLTLYRLFFAVLVLVALATQLVHGVRYIDTFRVANFFSFFTVESNIIGAAVFLVAAKALVTGKRDTELDYIRGAATLYMVVTGIVYVLLLSGADVQTPIPWVNAVLHYVFPIVILLDWIVDRPAKKLSYRGVLLWLVFPVAYLAYSLIRGPLAGNWYPYPFVNVTLLGYAKVAANSAAIAVAAVVLTFLLARIPRINLKAKN